MTQETTINPHKLKLSKNRFWSSGDELPLVRYIARVLADPVVEDLMILKNEFGLEVLLSTWDQLKERGEVAESVIPVTEGILEKLKDNI